MQSTHENIFIHPVASGLYAASDPSALYRTCPVPPVGGNRGAELLLALCAGGLWAVNDIVTQLRDLMNSGLTRWRLAV